ncbi:MAG TPA: 3-oxoadipate enol-lactonase [Anaeromyxobacteraceae bacterium]|jgi:3-oxoadipate enol-lactonase
MPFADAGPARLHYRIDGPEGAPPLLLSGSLGSDLAVWDPQIPALAARRRVIRYDARGHGSSPPAPGPCDVGRLAGDALCLLDALGVPRADFCGLSIGGLVGMVLGANAPARLGRLILCNTGAKIGTAEGWNARIDAVSRGGLEAVADGVLRRWLTPAFAAARPEEVARLRAMLLRTSPQGYAACCAAVRDADLRPAVSRIRAPTLVIAGARDEATPPASGRFLAEQIPGARFVELEAAHLSNVEAVAAFTGAVVAHLTEG